MKTYQREEISEVLNLSKRLISYWTDEGLIKPVIRSNGKGFNRYYSKKNIIEIVMLRDLRFFIPKLTHRAREILETYRRRKYKDTHLIIGKNGFNFWVETMKLEHLYELRFPTQLIIDFEHIRNYVKFHF